MRQGVKNDRLDALALCQHCERGNLKAFSTVRIPAENEDRKRAISRQRQQLMRERQRVAGVGRGLLAPQNAGAALELSLDKSDEKNRSI